MGERRCNLCEFWEVEPDLSRTLELGTCHRLPPAPSNNVAMAVAEYVSVIAWSGADEDADPKDFNGHSERRGITHWPITFGPIDWCGDFRAAQPPP